MRTLKTMFTLLLAIVWLPLTSHCLLLESASNLATLACCTHDSTPSEHSTGCESGACSVVEDAQYRCSEDRIVVPAVDRLVEIELPAAVELTLDPSEQLAQPHQNDWLESRSHWQFSSRAALPPRAPSIVS
jgi:hypothetical protein